MEMEVVARGGGTRGLVDVRGTGPGEALRGGGGRLFGGRGGGGRRRWRPPQIQDGVTSPGQVTSLADDAMSRFTHRASPSSPLSSRGTPS
ncbi:Hypothetical protein NTJ_04347 [Nesidiocoris tenuis]|uniref:Uncharacterized protein n=1 Tax=Nesidiocoris tenuis TaxID=355587 RepID=A0ABN7AH22_9HEMI|nr:Hypothetical protein NTJ_04347 [Nesidiocoris tenuis]